MELIKIEKEALVLDKVEKIKLKQCLNYCYHRLQHHKGCGLDGQVEMDFVQYMRSAL